jgi:hypothetical protein
MSALADSVSRLRLSGVVTLPRARQEPTLRAAASRMGNYLVNLVDRTRADRLITRIDVCDHAHKELVT